jgi:hypothetical protein
LEACIVLIETVSVVRSLPGDNQWLVKLSLGESRLGALADDLTGPSDDRDLPRSMSRACKPRSQSAVILVVRAICRRFLSR